MCRQEPEEVLIWVAVNARTAVSSRGLASAAALGFRTPPAPATDVTVALVVGEDEDEAAEVEMAGAVVVDKTLEVGEALGVDEAPGADETLAAGEETGLPGFLWVCFGVLAVVVPAGGEDEIARLEPEPPPIVNSWDKTM